MKHERFPPAALDIDTLQVLAGLRAMGMGISDMRTYQENRRRGRIAAAEQRDLLLRHAERVEAEIAKLHTHVAYLCGKADVWDARDRDDAESESAAWVRVHAVIETLELAR